MFVIIHNIYVHKIKNRDTVFLQIFCRQNVLKNDRNIYVH